MAAGAISCRASWPRCDRNVRGSLRRKTGTRREPRRRLPAHRLLEGGGDALGRALQGIVGEKGVWGGRLGLGMALDFPYHGQALAAHHRLRGKRMSQGADAHVVARLRRHPECGNAVSVPLGRGAERRGVHSVRRGDRSLRVSSRSVLRGIAPARFVGTVTECRYGCAHLPMAWSTADRIRFPSGQSGARGGKHLIPS